MTGYLLGPLEARWPGAAFLRPHYYEILGRLYEDTVYGRRPLPGRPADDVAFAIHADIQDAAHERAWERAHDEAHA